MSELGPDFDPRWHPIWTQAMTDFRGEDEEEPFVDVTVRMTVPASIAGTGIRAELSNLFGDEPVVIAHGAIGVDSGTGSRPGGGPGGGPGTWFVDVTFNGHPSVEIPAGESRWSDAVTVAVAHSGSIVVDLYLPEPTPYATANGFTFQRSAHGDFVGSSAFPFADSTPQSDGESGEVPTSEPEPEPEGTGWSLPAGGPFLRTLEVAGPRPRAVIVCLGSSSTAMGWPQFTAGLLSADARIAVLNRGIAGNRLRLDAPQPTPSWGRAGLSRFDEDVLGTAGATHVVIAYNSNDFGLPGRVTSADEMPTTAQMIDAYEELVDRSHAAGLTVILATITPLSPELALDTIREGLRRAINEWMRASAHPLVDFDAAIRSETNPSRLDAAYAAPDDTHPNVNGEKRLAQAMLDALQRLPGFAI
ncbi:GDSL-type esterase/lipase family protein [Subtercola endophyticus]|uniref:GDSL-type esterase/lipase family protein n=1 Tax=Subtercola endophyticus TaxID=2895559 RepID=UPI001E2EB8D5|nr:GDSL-type esterase/lipase family protein [Subtercola endophyticus]UFS60818.1 GDSL-type esterase/lipase family protein [Subtercola endophyticus]